MRMVDHLTTAAQSNALADHRVIVVPRSGALPACKADVIVSHLTINWRSLPRLIAFRARHAQTPLLHVEHSYTEAFTAQNVQARARFFTLLRTAYALFDRIVAVSRAQHDWMLRRGLCLGSALRQISPAVDLAPFLAQPHCQRSRRVVAGIGRLHRQKGFDVLVSAFRMVPDANAQLHIIGDGPERNALCSMAKGDHRIRFFGHCATPAESYMSVDIVAMPSRWEAFGLVALEARASGRALLCADVDGLHESGRGARFVNGHDPKVWAEALTQTLAAREETDYPDLTSDAFLDGWDNALTELVGQYRHAA